MIEMELLGEPIYIGTKAECRQFWKDNPDKRHQIWTQEESRRALLLGPDEIRQIMDNKKRQPGYTYKG